jgi:HK97 family phage portal protein
MQNRVTGFFKQFIIRTAAKFTAKDAQSWGWLTPNNESGEVVNSRTAMRLTAVYRCIALLSETVASLPKGVVDETEGYSKSDKSHPVNILLHRPNPTMTGFSFWETVMVGLLRHGNAYARIIRNPLGIPVRLKLLDFEKVAVYKNDADELFYTYEGEDIYYFDILHFRGISLNGFFGLSPIQVAAEALGVSLGAQRVAAKFYKNGLQQQGIIEADGHMTDEQFKQFQKHWQESYGGAKNGFGNVPVLEYGAKWKSMSLPFEQVQFIETREFQIEEICRIYGVPPHMVQDLRRATFSNIEHQDIAFAKYAVRSWCKRIEEECDAKLFTLKEQGTLGIKFNLDGMMRGDSTARSNYYQKGVTTGYLTRNEVRRMENLPPIEGLDEPLTPLNMVVDNTLNPNNQNNTTQP